MPTSRSTRRRSTGRNRFRFYSPRHNAHTVERLALETGLRYAIERDELVLLFQPKIAIATGRIAGVEALVRWQHPELGLLRPDRFISLAEETGLIAPIGLWVLRTACASARAWREAGMPLPVAVNLSARQFHDGRLVADVAAILAAAGLEPGALELEITESTVMQNPEQAVTLMHEFGRLGVRLAMDDFGIGYSSIGHLKRFPIDSLKLDRTFVRDLPDDPERRRDHAGGDCDGARAVDPRDRRRRRAAGAARAPAQRRLRRVPGLPVPAAADGGRAHPLRPGAAERLRPPARVSAPPPRVPQRVEDRAAGNVRKLRAGDTVVPFTRGGR